MNNVDKQYLELLQFILDNGVDKTDRTGTGTRSVFGYQMRFNLAEGFPLLTTKKIFTKAMIHELLWFISGDTNIKYLKNNGVRIWDEWCTSEGELGPVYGKQWREWSTNGEVVEIKKSEDYPEPYYIDFYGQEHLNKKYFKMGTIDQKLRNYWKKLMDRCYNPYHDNFKNYGSIGIYVCQRWHDPRNFVEDVKKLKGWNDKRTNWNQYELDKDFFGSKLYSPTTCIWLSLGDNKTYRRGIKPLKVIYPNGDERKFLSIQECARMLWLPPSSVHRAIINNKHYKQLKFELLDETKLYRRVRFIDQLSQVIERIKTKPDCRRLIVSAWNPVDIPNMKLPPCHCLFQFNVANGKLSCQLYQRSADVFLGVPFNIASYALLTHMVAQVTGLQVGYFIHTFGDVHIYNNHFDQVKEQLSRKPFDILPTLKLNPNVSSIDEFKFEDITIENYQCHPTIKGAVSV